MNKLIVALAAGISLSACSAGTRSPKMKKPQLMVQPTRAQASQAIA